MRLTILPPPSPPGASLSPDAVEAAIRLPDQPSIGAYSARSSPARSELRRPIPARPRARRYFDPSTGRFRRLERWISHNLSLRVFPHVPGMTLPYGRQLRRDLTLATAEISLFGLPLAFDGLKVLLVTDPHAGAFVSPRDLEGAFDRLLTAKPDLVLVGGDFTSSCVAEFRRAAGAFRQLRAPLGVYGVLGNHDHYTRDVERLKNLIAAEGIQLLDNSAVTIRRRQARFHLAGIDDLIMGRPDLDAALDGWSAEEPCVLLSHNPDIFFEAAKRKVELVLAGHTHGGQVRVPGLPVFVRQSRFRLDEGRFRIGRSQLVVSRGLGVVGLPLRVACPPEAVLLELRSG